MNSFERGLHQSIPFQEAADFFLKLKYGASPEAKFAERDAALLRDRLKQANAMMGGLGASPGAAGGAMGTPPAPASMAPAVPPPLPQAGKGMNMTGAKLASYHEDVGKSRAQVGLAQKFEKHEYTRGERALGNVGGLLGAAAGGVLGHKLGKNPATSAAGVLTGYALGKAHGKSLGTSLDSRAFKRGQNLHKHAEGEVFDEGSQPPPDPGVDMREYLAAEEQGRAAEQENHAEFLRARLQQAYAELQSAKDMATSSQQMAEQLQQMQATHEQQLTAAQQQSQLATQAAMQNVEQAHSLALKATSQALQAKDDAISTHQMAAQMRMAYQDMRGSIMDAVGQDAAAPIGEAIKQQGAAAQSVPVDPGADPNAGGAGPDPGGEGVPKEGGDTPNPQNVNKDALPQEQAGSSGAPGAAAPPASAPPTGDAFANQANASAGSSGSPFDGQDPKPTLQVGTLAQPGVGGSAKQASIPWQPIIQSAVGHLKERAPYIAGGAAVGAVLPQIEARRGHDDLREKVRTLEGNEKSFGNTLNLAQAKIRLAVGELSEEHPNMASAAGALVGGATGAMAGPDILKGLRALPSNLQRFRGPAGK